MILKVKGIEGDYLVKNESSIIQLKIDSNGDKTGETVEHIITDSIENSDDRYQITKTLEEINLN